MTENERKAENKTLFRLRLLTVLPAGGLGLGAVFLFLHMDNVLGYILFYLSYAIVGILYGLIKKKRFFRDVFPMVTIATPIAYWAMLLAQRRASSGLPETPLMAWYIVNLLTNFIYVITASVLLTVSGLITRRITQNSMNQTAPE